MFKAFDYVTNELIERDSKQELLELLNLRIAWYREMNKYNVQVWFAKGMYSLVRV